MFGINIYVVYILFQMNLLTYAKTVSYTKIYIYIYIVIVIVILFGGVLSSHPKT